MAIVYYGRRVTSPETDRGEVAPGGMRGTVYNAASQNLWAYQIGGWVGDAIVGAPVPTIRFAVYATDSNKDPTTRLGYSNQISANTTYIDITGGASHEPAVAVADNGFGNLAVRIYAGQRYCLAMLVTDGTASHSMKAAAFITADNEKFYNRTGLSQPPPSSWGALSSSTEGHQSLWLVCDANVAPDTPTGLSPSGTINETAPTFAANFRDQNAGHSGGTDRGDKLNQYTIQVRRVSDGASFWNQTFTATSSEQTADAISRAYGGTTLVRGTAYEWRVQVSDQFNTWSSWTAWTAFTPANLGFVTLDANPTGKTEDDTPDFQGRWTHQSAAAMTRVQVRLLSSTGTVLQTGADYDIADVVSSASPGTLFTVPWANTGLTTLTWGTSYQYQIRGYDGTNWSDWSAARTFTTNARPTIPLLIDPTNGAISTSLPILRATLSDADDTVATGLYPIARITEAVSLANRDFETNFNNWAHNFTSAGITSTAGRQTDSAQTGIGSGRIDISANTAGSGASTEWINDTWVKAGAGLTLNATVWTRTNNINEAGAIQIQFWADQGTTLLGTSNQTVQAPPSINTWYQISHSVDAPGGTVWARFVFRAVNRAASPGTGNVWWDEPRLDGNHDMTHVGNNVFEYQTTTLDLPAKGLTWTWAAIGYDGAIFSEAWSGLQSFVYADGPQLTITDPTEGEVHTTSSIPVAWTVNAGGPITHYRVQVFADSTTTSVYDSGWVAGSGTTATVPSGYVRNDTQYDLVVSLRNNLSLEGSSLTRNFSIDYVEPSPVANLVVTPVAYATDPWATSVRVSWDQTTYSTPEWQAYLVYRDGILLARLTSPTQIVFVDDTPVSGVTHTYAVSQVILTGLDELESTQVSGTAGVTLGGVVLTQIGAGGSVRTVLRNARERAHVAQGEEAVYRPLSGATPRTVRSPAHYWERSIEAAIFTDTWATAAQRRAEVEALAASLATLCYRDEQGRKDFVVIVPGSFQLRDQRVGWYSLSLTLRSERYSEGVT